MSWGTPKYIQFGDTGDIITFDQYEVEQALAAGIPQVVIHRAPGGYRIVGAVDERPVDGVVYTEFDEAKQERDRLNIQARQSAVTVVEAECGHYRLTAGDGYADDVHYTNRAAALAEAGRLQHLAAAA